jgi:CheY-like chemotaxis protein
MTPPRILFIGNRDWSEFAAAARWLVDHADVSFANDITGARARLHSQQAPFELVVMVHSRPGEHVHATFDELRAAAPMTPIVSVLGSFCEGEARTGRPWPGGVRVYAHQLVARFGAELARLQQRGSTTWALPFTATDEDRMVALRPSTPRLTARVAMISRDPQMATALCDALRAAGASTSSYREDLAGVDDNSDIVVWDFAAGFAAGRASFDRLVQRFPDAPKVVLLGFPRTQDIADAKAHGACGVISKPFLVEDLLWQLRDILPS